MSKIKCNKCGTCCKNKLGPIVFPNDIPAICNFLNIKSYVFLKEYCIKKTFASEQKSIDVYTIKSNNYGCIFLDNRLCKIFHVRPFQCVHAPLSFLGYYEYWKHMPCISPNDFKNIDTSISDKAIFKQLLEIGYQKYLQEE